MAYKSYAIAAGLVAAIAATMILILSRGDTGNKDKMKKDMKALKLTAWCMAGFAVLCMLGVFVGMQSKHKGLAASSAGSMGGMGGDPMGGDSLGPDGSM